MLPLVIGILVAQNRGTGAQDSRMLATVYTANKSIHHPKEFPAYTPDKPDL